MRHLFVGGLLFLSLVSLARLPAQEIEFYKKPSTPAEFWRALQFEIGVGKYEVAATHLRGLLAANPADADWVAMERKDGFTAFLRLRNIPRWSKVQADEDETRKNVQKLIELATTAVKANLSDPERVRKFAKNLTATPEEAAFALIELQRSGMEAVPTLIEMLREDPPTDLRVAILDALSSFDGSAVPPIVAALDLPNPLLTLELLDLLRRRPDYLALPFREETNIVPRLWYFSAAMKRNPELLRERARNMLQGLVPRDLASPRVPERNTPEFNLNVAARVFLDHQARFLTKETVTLWRLDATGKLERKAMPTSEAEETLGLQYARWSLEVKPDYLPAQKTFLYLALDRPALQATDAPLAAAAPELYAILTAAPFEMLTALTTDAVRDQRTSMAVACINALADRMDARATRAAFLAKLLDTADRRVQFAAAEALLKSPLPHTHGRQAQIVKILAATAEVIPGDTGKPQALLIDPDSARSDNLAEVLRRAGFAVTVRRTGRELFAFLRESPKIDLLLVDHHVRVPNLPELLAQVRADLYAGPIPMLVVASGDRAATAHPTTLMLRAVTLYAAMELFEAVNQRARDLRIVSGEPPDVRFNDRVGRVRKLLEDSGITVTQDVLDRIEYLTLMTIPSVEIPGLPLELNQSKLVLPAGQRALRLKLLKPVMDADPMPFAKPELYSPVLAQGIVKLEASLRPEMVAFADVLMSIVQEGQKDALGRYVQEPLPVLSLRNKDVETRLNYLTHGLSRVKVIPELFTERSLAEELQGFITIRQPAQTQARRKTEAVLAMAYLVKMASGELPGYPVALAEATVRKNLNDPDLAAAAVEIVARLPGKEAQQDLAGVVLGIDRPAVLRSRAAELLLRGIQQSGNLLGPMPQEMLLTLADREADPALKIRLMAILGVLQPSAKETGDRLLKYVPGVAPMPAEKKDEPEPKKDP